MGAAESAQQVDEDDDWFNCANRRGDTWCVGCDPGERHTVLTLHYPPRPSSQETNLEQMLRPENLKSTILVNRHTSCRTKQMVVTTVSLTWLKRAEKVLLSGDCVGSVLYIISEDDVPCVRMFLRVISLCLHAI